ncbi:MAG: hypothetical protein ACTSPB_03960 [Candidatus Thorarchaeota archaeon]
MEDIRLEKALETLYDHMRGKLPPETRKICPALRLVADLLVAVKSENNREIALEMGMICDEEWECHCGK